jgi:diaminopimelate epimerase
MRLAFTKMQGLGNDFVLFDALNQPLSLQPAQVRRIADRHFGVGCDQVLLLEPPRNGKADVYYRIYNADGNEVEHCGNGVRCVARYLRDTGRVKRDELVMQTINGEARVRLESNDHVRVNMGAPRFAPVDIPFIAPARAPRYDLDVAGVTLTIGAVSMGNPHAVLIVDNIDQAPVATLGPQLERHPRFPQGVNASFLQILNPNHVRLRVFERGAGETLACGTGACAAVAVGRMWGQLQREVDVQLRGGHLSIAWDGEGEPVWMTGPAERVFEGHIEL